MPNFGTLDIVDLRTNWENEDECFTPWLSEHLTLLNNVLNMNLECVDRNVEVGRYKCDLLCRNTEDHSSVVIENQLNEFDHDHLGKALVYAAGLSVRTIIWITNEHRKTLDWMNGSTHDGFQFFGLQLEVIQNPEQPAINKLELPGIKLSNVGTELFRIVEQTESLESIQELKKYFRSIGMPMVEVSYGDFREN